MTTEIKPGKWRLSDGTEVEVLLVHPTDAIVKVKDSPTRFHVWLHMHEFSGAMFIGDSNEE